MIRNLLIFITLSMLSLKSVAKDIAIEDFFKRSVMTDVKISPDGKHLAFVVNKDNQDLLTIFDRKTKKAKGYEYGNNIRINQFYWANNERLIVIAAKFVGFLDRKGGPPTVYGINIDGSKRTVLYSRDNRARISVINLLPDQPKWVLVSKSHFGDKGITKLHRMNVMNGKMDYIGQQPAAPMKNGEFGFTSVIVNPEGDPRVVIRYSTSNSKEFGHGDIVFYYKEPNENDWLTLDIETTKPNTSITPLSVSKDNEYAYFTSNIETKTNALYRLNLKHGKYEKVFSNDLVDLGSGVRDFDGQLIGIRYDSDFSRIKFLDNENSITKLYKKMYASFPDSNVYLTSHTDDESLVVVYVSSDTNPGEYFIFDTKKQSLARFGKSRPWIAPKDMAYMNPISYTTRDGIKIHGYLTLPKGKTKNLPLIINPHGGPHGPRDSWGFNPEVQFLANRGYAVLQMNFRGSGGYGVQFEHSGHRKWGREMQDDVTDATLWAIKQGIADKDRICIYGGSYGGYATLAGVVREPDMYKCGLGYVGVYDLTGMRKYGDIPQSTSGMKFLDKVLGKDPVELKANSPAQNVHKIKAALFIAHGEDDVRVPMEQYEILKKNLDAAKIPFKSMLRDEGHGYQQLENRIDFYGAMEEFFKEHIGS